MNAIQLSYQEGYGNVVKRRNEGNQTVANSLLTWLNCLWDLMTVEERQPFFAPGVLKPELARPVASPNRVVLKMRKGFNKHRLAHVSRTELDE